MKKQRKHYTPEEKVAILRRHLLDKEPISKLCDELGLQSTVFHRWQKDKGEVPGGATPDHLRQRATVHCQRLQGVHSDLGHDSRQNVAVLSPIERENRTMAQIAQRGVHPAGNAAVAGRRAATGAGLRRTLQQRSPEQRGWLHHAKGHARRASAGDPCRAGSEAGGGAETAPGSPAERRLKNEENTFRVG